MRTSAEIEATLTGLRAQFERLAEKEPPDRAAGRLKPSALKQVTRSMDGDLRRYCDLRDRIGTEESALHLARARERKAADRAAAEARQWTAESLKGVTHVRSLNGWETVARVNRTTVSAVVPPGWNAVRIPFDQIVEVRTILSAPGEGDQR